MIYYVSRDWSNGSNLSTSILVNDGNNVHSCKHWTPSMPARHVLEVYLHIVGIRQTDNHILVAAWDPTVVIISFQHTCQMQKFGMVCSSPLLITVDVRGTSDRRLRTIYMCAPRKWCLTSCGPNWQLCGWLASEMSIEKIFPQCSLLKTRDWHGFGQMLLKMLHVLYKATIPVPSKWASSWDVNSVLLIWH